MEETPAKKEFNFHKLSFLLSKNIFENKIGWEGGG